MGNIAFLLGRLVSLFLLEKQVMCKFLTANENAVIEQAALLMAKVMEQSPVYQSGTTFNDPSMVMDFLKMKLGLKEREEFMVLFLDNQHKLLSAEILFQGTINATAVYPREVIKRALELNAAALILAHNHPSGQVTPSQSDRNITTKIKDAAALFDIRLLDHIIVGGTTTYSFAENLDL